MLKSFLYAQNLLTAVLRRDDRGATAVEYGLIVALVAAAIVATLITVGTNISTTFGNIAGHL